MHERDYPDVSGPAAMAVGGSAAPCPVVYLRLTITDTSGVLVDGNHAFNPLAKVTRLFWYRLPASWVCAGRLVPARRQRLLDLIYGPGRQVGMLDSDPYIILDIRERVLSAAEARRRPWLGDRAACYAWRDSDVLQEIIPASL
ncbi:MAG TPA: hypothetical protein VES42_02705 [Pilimelia sp.]|nr:hypothetical protein [Pilimelia sp.]